MKLVNERIEKDKLVKEYSRDGKDVHVVVKKLVHDETPQPKKPQEQPPQEEQQSTDNYALWRLQQLEDKINYLYYKEKGVIK